MAEQRYHVGRDFLPAADVACFKRWVDAAGHLMDMMREYADEDDDAAFDSATPDTTGYSSYEDWIASGDAPNMLATVQSILPDDPPVEDQDYRATVEDSSMRMVAFWLLRVGCADPGHDLDLSTGTGPE